MPNRQRDLQPNATGAYVAAFLASKYSGEEFTLDDVIASIGADRTLRAEVTMAGERGAAKRAGLDAKAVRYMLIAARHFGLIVAENGGKFSKV